MKSGRQIEVFIEAGRKRVFASALDWPGWARSGPTEEQPGWTAAAQAAVPARAALLAAGLLAT